MLGAAGLLLVGCADAGEPGPANLSLRYFDRKALDEPTPAAVAATPLLQAEQLNARGCMAWLEGDLKGAAEQFRAAAKIDPSLLPAYLNLAAVRRLAAGSAAGVEPLESMTSAPDPSGSILHQRAWGWLVAALTDRDAVAIAAGLRQLDESAAAGEALLFPAVNLRMARWLTRHSPPVSPPAELAELGDPGRFMLAEFHRLKGDWREAERLYGELLERHPRDGHLQARLGAVRFARDDFAGAEAAFSSAAAALGETAAAQASLYAGIARARGGGVLPTVQSSNPWVTWQGSVLAGSAPPWRIAWRYGGRSQPRLWAEWTDSWFLRAQHEILQGKSTPLSEEVAQHGAPWLLSYTMAGGRL